MGHQLVSSKNTNFTKLKGIMSQISSEKEFKQKNMSNLELSKDILSDVSQIKREGNPGKKKKKKINQPSFETK